MRDIRTNVIYLTTKCNLDCSYCYERRNRLTEGFVHKEATKEDVHLFIDELVEREDDINSCVVIFGGEPLLKPDLIEEVIDYGVSKKPGKISYDIITNATLIDENTALRLLKIYKKLQENYSSFQLEISYDVSGQSERKYANGKDTNNDVLSSLKLLRSLNIPYTISYVVNPSNYANVIRDVLYIIIALKAEKVCIKWARYDLEKIHIDVDEIKSAISNDLFYIFNKYNVPICEEVCPVCRLCDKCKSGNNYYIPGKGNYKIESYTNIDFNHFII